MLDDSELTMFRMRHNTDTEDYRIVIALNFTRQRAMYAVSSIRNYFKRGFIQVAENGL